MGEYANYRGNRVKIGTCEDLYYLRADQRGKVYGGDLGSRPDDYWNAGVRFRFPFPNEDGIEPGTFEDYDRGEQIPGGWTLPDDYEHEKDCHDGYSIKQQRLIDGELWTVVACDSCGCKWRLPREEAEAVAVAFRSAELHAIADRILAGYTIPA